jgi:hypothetical protein
MTFSALETLIEPAAVKDGAAVVQESVLAAGVTAAVAVTPPTLLAPHSSL